MRIALCLAVLVAAGLPLLAAEKSSVADRPNILLIMADDLGMGDLGCYGQKQLKTPNIDRLAAEGMQFFSAYSGASVCAPSRCSLMTGRHMGHATVRGNWEVYPEGQAPLGQDEVTVAMMLKEAGYATGICGKWGLGGPESGSDPNDKGFDLFFGYNCQRHAHRYLTDYLYCNRERIKILQAPERRLYSQNLITDASLRFIRENHRRPFFLFCAWTVPHGIWRIDQVPSVDAYADTNWSDTEKVYAAMVEGLDSDVGRVLETLKELEMDRKTLVIFASDNGGVGGEVAKRLEAMPSVAKGAASSRAASACRCSPGGRVAARRAAKPATGRPRSGTSCRRHADLAGQAPPPADVDGVSIVPVLLGKKPPRAAVLGAPAAALARA